MTITVRSLHRYPVKGLRGNPLDEAAVTLIGLEGDRRWMVISPDGEFMSQRKNGDMARIDAALTPNSLELRHEGGALQVAQPGEDAERLPVMVWHAWMEAFCAGPDADRWLTDLLGVPCRLVFLQDERARSVEADSNAGDDHVSFADAFPILATSHSSLRALNEALGGHGPVPMDRFRPNIVFDADDPEALAAWAEDGWRRVRIGDMLFRAPKPCGRCVVITRDQRTGAIAAPGEPLRTLGQLNRRAEGIVFGANLIPETTGRIRVGDPVEPVG